MLTTSNARNIKVSGADLNKILFRNFTGKSTNNNPGGSPMGSFTLVLKDEKAAELENLGFNVKRRANYVGEEEARLDIFVRYDKYPPTVIRIVNGQELYLDKESVEILDHDEIENVELEINPSRYDFGGHRGIKAYLAVGKFYVASDNLANRYGGEAPF